MVPSESAYDQNSSLAPGTSHLTRRTSEPLQVEQLIPNHHIHSNGCSSGERGLFINPLDFPPGLVPEKNISD